MTATFTCPECGTATDMVTRTSGGLKCICNSCEHQWLSDDQGKVMTPPSEPDGRAHVLRLGQRAGHVAVFASMPTRQALNLLTETPMETTPWASGIPKMRRPVRHDMVQRDSTELGATPPVAKGRTAALAAIPREPREPTGATAPFNQRRTPRWLDRAQRLRIRGDRALARAFDRLAHPVQDIAPGTFDYSGPVELHRVESQAAYLIARVLERKKHPCTRCGGEGTVVPEGETEPVACSACHGTGEVRRRQEAEGDDQQAHHALWDRAVDFAEKAGEISGPMMLINFLAETYNGGIEQYISNGYSGEFNFVVRYLKSLKSTQAQQLASRLMSLTPTFNEAVEAYNASMEYHDGERSEEDPFENFQNDFGIAEDWIYNSANIDPILAEMAGPAPAAVAPAGAPAQEAVADNPTFKARPFVQSDWYGYAGAEKPDEETEPVIGEVTIDGKNATVIVDKIGVQVLVDNDEAPNGVDVYSFYTPFAQGRGIAAQVSRMKTVQELVAAGFEKIM